MDAVRWLDLAARLAETWVHRPTTPNRVVMDLTRRCNLRCTMCRTWRIEPGHELSPDEIARTLDQLPRLTWLDLTGGELFLRKDALDVVRVVLDHAPALRVLHFPTNGWFTARVVEAAREIRARRPEIELIITVSLDGPPALHDQIRGRPGSFTRAVETYKALRKIPDIKTYVGTTITPENESRIPALLDELRAALPDFRPRDWHWNLLQISQHFFDNEDLAPAAAALAPKNLVRDHVRRRGLPRNLVELMELVFLLNLDFYRRGEPAGIPCQALRSACFISPEGDVHPCHVYDRPVGNVRRDDLAKLWAAPHVKQARADIEQLKCGGCFTACEAYPGIAGAPLATIKQTARRALTVLRETRDPGDMLGK